MGEVQPGWYDSGHGKQRWFDGEAWSNRYREIPPPPPPPVDYDPKMDTASAPALQPKKSGKGTSFGCLGCLGLVIITAAAFAIIGSNRPDSGSSNKFEAISQCEARIERLLKAPATAEFDTDATGANANWTVTGTVDSQNGFGALVRSSFKCTVVVGAENATTTVDYLE